MLQLDKETKVDPDDMSANAINEGISQIMESIAKEVVKIKPS